MVANFLVCVCVRVCAYCVDLSEWDGLGCVGLVGLLWLVRLSGVVVLPMMEFARGVWWWWSGMTSAPLQTISVGLFLAATLWATPSNH